MNRGADDQEGAVMKSPLLVAVALFAPLPRLFTYAWPASLGNPEVGVRLRVPLAAALRTGVVERVLTAVEASEIAQDRLKWVEDRLDHAPLLPPQYVIWSARLAAYYLALPGDRWALPLAWAADEQRRRFRPRDTVRLSQENPALSFLFRNLTPLTQATIVARLGASDSYWQLRQAEIDGLIEEVVEPLATLHRNDEPVVAQLTPPQQQAVDALALSGDRFAPHLLFGCTGSGKTEVYIRAARRVVDQGGQVLILVPEIGLTPMWLARVAQRLGVVAAWHSGLKPRQKHAVRHALDRVDCVVGTRSSLFLPLQRLGLIVVDEEHDASFKQSDGVAFSARDMAVLLAQQLQIPLVLGSATPSVESWRLASEGRYRLLTLPSRIGRASTVTTQVIDMRGSRDILSPGLLAALEATHAAGQQSILYLNRRGYAPALHCTACGHVPLCRHCAARLTLHRGRGELRCHLCGWKRRVQDRCDSCGEVALLPLGAGTERIFELLAERLPTLATARMDRDAIRSPEDLSVLLGQFGSGEVDCLIGTQMVVKGHHFPNVTLVGVVQADLGLNLPDLRAAERWWQQLTQVIGRAGRGEVAGRTLLQSYQPDHPWLSRLGDAYAESILREELALRRDMQAPPFSRWVRVVFSALHTERALDAAQQMVDGVASLLTAEVGCIGPIPCAIERINRRFRYEVLLRDPSRNCLPWALAPLLTQPIPRGVRRRIDVDPVEMM
ncbi:MAG: primosomal protein N' [Mariprofundales bacterium]|nr:primosomal protein N' [Mariprofundales bacterium]